MNKDEKDMCGNCTGACDGCGAHDQWGEYTIEIGDTVPDMDLSAYHNDEEKKINLSDYRGKWLILFFYPKDFTFVCPTELEEMQNYYGKFQNNSLDQRKRNKGSRAVGERIS